VPKLSVTGEDRWVVTMNEETGAWTWTRFLEENFVAYVWDKGLRPIRYLSGCMIGEVVYEYRLAVFFDLEAAKHAAMDWALSLKLKMKAAQSL
jgi:hypothetical protein